MATEDSAMQSAGRRFRRTAKIDSQQALGALTRITRMCFRYPWRVALAFGATVPAVLMQLAIPVILGRAVDVSLTMSEGATDVGALVLLALALLAASVLRGMFTLVQNYSAESVGHALAHDLRNAI